MTSAVPHRVRSNPSRRQKESWPWSLIIEGRLRRMKAEGLARNTLVALKDAVRLQQSASRISHGSLDAECSLSPRRRSRSRRQDLRLARFHLRTRHEINGCRPGGKQIEPRYQLGSERWQKRP